MHIVPPITVPTSSWPDVGLMLGQRRRRWPNIKPTSGQRLVIAGEIRDT